MNDLLREFLGPALGQVVCARDADPFGTLASLPPGLEQHRSTCANFSGQDCRMCWQWHQ